MSTDNLLPLLIGLLVFVGVAAFIFWGSSFIAHERSADVPLSQTAGSRDQEEAFGQKAVKDAVAICCLGVVMVLAARTLLSGSTDQPGANPSAQQAINAATVPKLGAASSLVANKIGNNHKFEEVTIQGGIGVLADGSWAFWVKDGKVFALNGLAKSLDPSLDYGPPGLGSEDLRQALRPTPPQSEPTFGPTGHVNPLGSELHEIIRKKGYLAGDADTTNSTAIWNHRTTSASITGSFEGRGTGMFNRKAVRLEMRRGGVLIWSAERLRVSGNSISIDSGSGWHTADIEG